MVKTQIEMKKRRFGCFWNYEEEVRTGKMKISIWKVNNNNNDDDDDILIVVPWILINSITRNNNNKEKIKIKMKKGKEIKFKRIGKRNKMKKKKLVINKGDVIKHPWENEYYYVDKENCCSFPEIFFHEVNNSDGFGVLSHIISYLSYQEILFCMIYLSKVFYKASKCVLQERKLNDFDYDLLFHEKCYLGESLIIFFIEKNKSFNINKRINTCIDIPLQPRKCIEYNLLMYSMMKGYKTLFDLLYSKVELISEVYLCVLFAIRGKNIEIFKTVMNNPKITGNDLKKAMKDLVFRFYKDKNNWIVRYDEDSPYIVSRSTFKNMLNVILNCNKKLDKKVKFNNLRGVVGIVDELCKLGIYDCLKACLPLARTQTNLLVHFLNSCNNDTDFVDERVKCFELVLGKSDQEAFYYMLSLFYKGKEEEKSSEFRKKIINLLENTNNFQVFQELVRYNNYGDENYFFRNYKRFGKKINLNFFMKILPHKRIKVLKFLLTSKEFNIDPSLNNNNAIVMCTLFKELIIDILKMLLKDKRVDPLAQNYQSLRQFVYFYDDTKENVLLLERVLKEYKTGIICDENWNKVIRDAKIFSKTGFVKILTHFNQQ